MDQPVSPPVSTVAMRRELAEDTELAARTMAAILTAVRWGSEHEREVRNLMATHLKMTQANASNYANAWPALYSARLDDQTVAAINVLIDQYRESARLKPVPANSYAQTIFRNAQQISR
jgi:ABC-type nitrate/sulfonate/bicarbonate transport system substrate-binding protein